ncbi:biotin-dependent carboxyltransferase family protein [Marinobacter sp. OP 3.4]|uniref:5-oxoprolinase subunit C family protein n=1 Tax=Marinobacter sp. OP 3.4 TaxID=3076501 RepID=UPI002E1E650E
MTGLRVDHAGPRTTVQDLGRQGYQHQGLSPGGAADLASFRWANHLLDNPANAACLEITFGGFSAVARQPLLLAITGADCGPTVNDQPVGHWRAFTMAPGDCLRLDRPRSGLLTYLAVAGGWHTRAFCGSRSAVAREGLTDLGLLEGGAELPVTTSDPVTAPEHYRAREVPAKLRPDMATDAPLRVMPGPERNAFSHTDLARFIHGRYTIGQQSDRMGYRLDGPALQSPGGITSRGVCRGTIQVPGDGKPMVLLNDRQTIGGYPVPGIVPALDCGRLAQKRPGERIEFQWADVADCQSGRMLFERLLATSQWRHDGTLHCRWTD